MMKYLKYLALAGDILFILWIVYNGIDEGFRPISIVQAASLCGLVILLVLNITLLWKQK